MWVNENKYKQKLLEVKEVENRAKKALGYLTKELQMLELKNDIQTKVKTDLDQQQREYFLHQQIKKYDFEKKCFINDTIDLKNSFVACAGLANNQLFKNMIEEKYPTNNIFYLYPDHHNYNTKDILDIKESLKQINSKILVTTKKDFYKLYSEFKDYHIYILDVKHTLQDKSEIIDFIK